MSQQHLASPESELTSPTEEYFSIPDGDGSACNGISSLSLNDEADFCAQTESSQDREQNLSITASNNIANVRIDLQFPLQFYGTICIASYVGALLRVGVSYFRIWKVETSYTVMFANIVGSFVIGYMRHCKADALARNDIKQIVFLGITSGFCGSLTSFSTWAMESNKSLFLQFDSSYGNSASSYNGGRFFEWIVSLWIGVAVPLSALQLGIFVSSRYSINSFFEPANRKASNYMILYCIYAAVIISNIVLVVTPIIASLAHEDYLLSWSYLFYTALFGFVGAVCRYHLSLRNKERPTFPIGTFQANVTGTCLLALFTVLSKFAVDYYDIDVQSVLFGLSFGFCGCLTTVSTFVNEINDLSAVDAYKYSIGTNLAAQVGIFFIYNIYSYTVMRPDIVMPKTIDQCFTYQKYCGILLDRVGCPAFFVENTACTNMHDYSTFVGSCSCGAFDGTRVGELIVDSQVKYNISNSFVAVWPTDALSSTFPTEVVDYCLTFTNVCDHYWNRVGCPAEKRYINACGRHGVTHAVNQCVCAGAIDIPSNRVKEIVVDALLLRRYDLMPYNSYVTTNTTNFCTAWRRTCDIILEHVQCPVRKRVVTGCTNDYNYNTYPSVGATCSCGQLEMGSRVAEDLYDAIVRPNSLIKRISHDQNVWDICSSYRRVCNQFLDKIGCPQNIRAVTTCGNASSMYPHGVVQEFNGTCTCGNLSELSLRNVETIIDSLLAEDINNDILYIAPPQAPYTLLIASNPFRQLTNPSTTPIPTQ